MSKSKNDKAWERIFEKYDILKNIDNDCEYVIYANQINEFREARLMTKFDHKKNLPEVFQQNNLSILPISRGSYLISSFNIHYDIQKEDDIEIKKITAPDYIETFDYKNITSEANALHCAYFTGIIAEFIHESLVTPTISGRMSSGSFKFNIFNASLEKDTTVNVENAQLEIDGGYESPSYLSLVEAKNAISDDLLVRQLYYPFRLWFQKISKPIKNIFLVYSNSMFSLYEFNFTNPTHYNSITLVRSGHYSLEEMNISLNEITEIANHITIIEEPEIPFPQADNFYRVINLCELLYESELTKDEITDNYDFDPRQTNYYTDACRYLGLVERKSIEGEIYFLLTDLGRTLFKLSYRSRQLKFVKRILEHKIFHRVFNMFLRNGNIPSKEEVVQQMKECNLYEVESDSTYQRRASTILGWIKWIINLQK